MTKENHRQNQRDALERKNVRERLEWQAYFSKRCYNVLPPNSMMRFERNNRDLSGNMTGRDHENQSHDVWLRGDELDCGWERPRSEKD